MKNLFFALITTCLAAGVILLAVRTTLPEHFWLWFVGLAGPIIGALQFAIAQVRKAFVP